jgi:hypothetical protein
METRNNVKPMLCLFFVGSLLFGCSTTDVVVFDSTSRPPTAENEVEVLLEKPDRPYKVIARIKFAPDAFVADYQSQTNEVIKRAAELGADVVIVSYDSEVIGYYGMTAESKVTIGQAIVYENEPD